MYCPQAYRKEDSKYHYQFIQKHPFATMVIHEEAFLATHIPILTKGTAAAFHLEGHVAKSNPQAAWLKDGMEALFIFQGPHAYISSSWYGYEDISTWDYSAVHVRATIQIQTAVQLETSLQKLVYAFEKEQISPKFYHDIPSKILQDHLPYIVGFTAKPISIEGIAKYHQDASPATRNRICNALRKDATTAAVADAIENEASYCQHTNTTTK
ncbi:FMN-binding negative transcriptional regulator [Marixanthomonas spongiae]|nr:FMN-binding negative transcriptional regulator [Marixanthomonas spongiae]